MTNQDFFVNLKFKLEDLSKDITKGAASNFLNEVRKISQELKKLDIQNIPEFKDIFQMGGKIRIDLDFNENEFKKINLHLEEIKFALKELTSGQVLSKELLNLFNTIENFAKTLNTISVNKNIDLSFIKKVITDYKEAIEALPQKPLNENTIINFLENIYNFLNLIKKIGAEINSLQDYKFPSKKTIKNFFENFNDIFVYIQEFNKTLRADFIQLTQIENFQSLIGKEKEIREFVISRLELFIETFTRITNIVSNSFPHLLRTFTTYKDDINNYIETIVNFIKQFNISNLMTISESEIENIKKFFKMLSEILQELSKVNETIYTPGKYINTDNLLRDLRNLTGIVKEIELVIKDLQNISKVNQIKINKLDITHLFTLINEITKEVENFLKNNNFDSVISGDILKKWEGIDTFLANLTSILKNLSNFKTIKINNQQAENLLEGLKIFLRISQELSSLKTTIQSNLNTDELFFTREDIENLGRIGFILRDLSFFIQNLFDIISNTSIQNFDDIVPKIEKYFNIIRTVLQRIADIIPYINTIYQNLNTGVKLSNFTDFNTFLNSFIYNIDTSNEQLKEIINRNTNFNNTLRMVSTTSERTIQELRNWKELLKGRVINEFQEIFLGSYDLNKILSEYFGRFSSINRVNFSKFNLDILTKLKEILVGADINNPQLVRAIFNNFKNTLRKVGIYLKNTSNINEMKQILSEWEQAIRGLFVSGFSQVNLKLISEHRKTLDYYLNQLDKSLDKTLPYILDKIKNILSKYYKTLGYKSKYEVFNIFKTGIGVEEIINLGLSRITNQIDKQELEKLNKRLQSIIENANKAESRIENVLKQVKVQKGLSFSDEDLQQLDRVLQHLTWKTFQVSWGFIYINMALDKTITKIKDFLRDVIQTSRELQLIQIRLRGLSEQTSKFASYSQQEFKELMAISAKTPYTIRDISEAWTQFKALGIDNIKIFKDTIDTAVTFGIEVSKIADDIARAIQGDATAFKNLRHSIGLTNVVIKQFGGSVDNSGRLSNKTFKDIKNNAEALIRYLQRYTGASEKTISSLSQAISNLQDIVNIFYAKTAENLAGLGDYLGKITLSILNIYRTQEGLINELSKTFGTFLLIIAGSIPAIEGLSKAFIIFNDVVFMFMTGISSFGMSLTVLPKFLNNTQRAIKELSLAMGISVKQAESLVNMYRNLHKVVASSSFEIFEIFMNKAISFALNLINFAISFIKTHFFGLLISTLMTIWGIYTKNTILEIERRRWEFNKVKKLLSEDLGATILPEITEETFNFYEILKKITDISDKLVQNFGLSEEKAFKMSKNILLQQSSIEDIYKYMLQLSYLKPFRFTINMQEYIDKLEDYKQAIETFNQTPMFGIQQNLVRTTLASIIYYIKIESILRDFIKRITTRKPVEKLPIDFYQQIFTPKYYQDLTKILEIKDKVFTSAKLETRLLIEQTNDFFNLFKKELQKKLIKYIFNLERQILEIIKKISPETKINDIKNLSEEILDKLNKNKDFQRLYKDYNLSLFILRNLKVIDTYNLLSKKYLQILSKEDTQEINIPEMFRKAQLFKKNISYLNYNLREFFRNFTTSTELISGINKFIEDISRLSKEDFIDNLIDYFKNKYKLLKGTDVDIRESISSKLEGKIVKYITKNEYINSIIERIQNEILEAFKTNTRETILNYPKVLNEILDRIVQNLINLKIIEETHRKEVERIIRVALFGNTISNIIFILRKGIVNLSDEVKQVLLQALNKIKMSDEIRNEIKQSIESGIIILTRENKKIFKNIIKNIKNINKYYQELSKLQFPEENLNKINKAELNLINTIFSTLINKIKNWLKDFKEKIEKERIFKEIEKRIKEQRKEVLKERDRIIRKNLEVFWSNIINAIEKNIEEESKIKRIDLKTFWNNLINSIKQKPMYQKQIEKAFKDIIKNIGKEISEQVKKSFKNIYKDIYEDIKALSIIYTFLNNLIKDIIKNVGKKISEQIKKSFKNIYKDITEDIKALSMIYTFLNNLIKDIIKNISKEISGQIKKNFKNIYKDIKVLSMIYTFLNNLIRDITLRLSIWLDFFKLSIYVISNNFNKKISNSLLLLYIKYNKITKDILNTIDTGFINFINKPKKILTKIWKGIIQGVSPIIEALLKLGDLLIKGVLWVKELILGLVIWVGNIIKKIFSPIGKVLLDLFTGRIFTKTIDIISPKVKEFFEKSINNLLNKFKKPETPPGVPKNIDKLTTEFSKNIRGVSSNLKTLAEIIEEVGKKFQDIRDYKVLQDVKNKILKLKSPFQSLYLIPETLEKQVQQVSGIEKALLRLGIRRFLRGEYKLGPTLLKIAEAWDNTIEKGLTTYEKMVLEGIKRSGFLKNILTFVGKTLRFIADSFFKIGAIIFNIFVDIIDSFIGAFYISQKTGETWIKAFSERFKDTLTGMILSFISNLFKGSFWKNLINNIFNTFLTILSKFADFLWGGTIQKIIEQQEKKKLQDKVKNILISKGLNTDDLNKATDKINNFIKDTINELQTTLNKFNQNLQNINIEEFGYAIQEYLRNIFDILVNSKVNFAGKEITLSDLLKEDNLLKYQIEDITQIKILWKSILESIKAYNDAIDKAIDLIKKLYDNTFSYEEMRKKYYDELIQNLKEDEKGVSELLDEDLKKLEDVYNRIENKKKELIQKLEKFKIKINFDTDKINFKDIVNKLKEKLSIKFEVELKEDMKEEERIKKITNFINILRNTADLTDKEVDRLNKILGDYTTSKNKTQKQEIEKYFKGEEITQPQYITKEDLVLREKINKYQKEGINLQEEINRLEEEYNNLLNNTQFNIGKIVQKLKELRDISQEIKEKTKGFDIDFLKNLIDITELQIKENTETLFNLMDIYSMKKTEIENSNRELEIKIGIAERKKEEAIKKMQETQDSSQKEKFKKEIEQYEKEIKNYENQKQKNQAILRITEDMIKQLNNKQTALKKNLELYKEEYKNLKDNYIMSQFLNKNLVQSLSQTINFNRNLRSQRGFFENKDIPLFYKANNILKSMGLNSKEINTLMSKFFDKSGKITEEGILFVRNIFNEYYKNEKEYYDLQKEYIDRNLIGLQKISSITQLNNEIEYNTNLTLEERQDLINELLDLQLEELKNLTDIYTGWSKLKEIIRYIGSSSTLTDKQKLTLTDKLTQKAEEYLDLTKNIYEYETSIDEILKQQLVKGLQAIKLNKEKYEKMLDVIKDYKEDKKIEAYIYVLNKVIKDNLLPQEVIEELKERIYNDLFNTETFENHFQKIKEKFIETFKDEKLFNLERVLNPKKIGEFIQNYFKKNNIKINIDFKSDAFKKLIKELGDSLIQIFKEKIDELKGVIEDLRSKFNIPKKEESEEDKIERLYQEGIIFYDEYRSAKSAAGILKTSEEQEKKGGMPYNETVLQWNKNIIGNVLDKAEKRLKQKEEELKAQETKTTADFNTSVNNFATAVKNFENAVLALGGLIASLGKGGGAVGGTTQNNQNQQTNQTNQTNINQTNVNNNVNIINNLPSGSVYFPFLGPTE